MTTQVSQDESSIARTRFLKLMSDEVDRAIKKHGDDRWKRHEFYGIILEEVEEMWDAIKCDDPDEHLLEEMVQVAAMCLRFAETTPDLQTAIECMHIRNAIRDKRD